MTYIIRKLVSNINWKKVFFPILDDFESINNNDSDSARISINNWELANNSEEYNEILEKINLKKQSKISDNHEIIILNKEK
jgi:hypothetical protein